MKQKSKFKKTEIGTIPEDWEIKNLGEEIELCYGKGLSKKNRIPGPYPVFGSNGIVGSHNEFLVEGPGIIIGRKGSVGEVKFSKNNFWPIDTTYYLKVKKKGSTDFWYYFLLTLKLNRMNSHSAVPGLNRDMVYELKKKIPDEKEQTAIAKILSDLDSKIELLQKQNKTLEAIAQALFKHWFVDFEFPNEEGKPYKSSGGEMVFYEELGKEIPKGWESGRLEELFKFVKGKKPRRVSEQYNENYLPQILIETLNGKKPVFADPEKMILVDKKNPIMVMDGASSGRIEIGFIGILGSTLALLKINNSDFNNIVYYFLKTKEEDINKNTTGTSIPHTDKSKVYNYEVSLPENNNLANRFQEETSIIISKIILNKEKIRSLQKIRDLLLPKLMTGKIRVPVEVE